METLHDAGDRLPSHVHRNAYLTVAVLGTYCEGWRDCDEVCSPNSVRYLPAGEEHMNRFPVRTLCLNIELSSEVTERYVRSSGTPVGELRNPFARTLGRRLCAEIGQQDNLTELGALSAIVDLLHLLSSGARTGDRWPAPWLVRVRDYIEEHCTFALRLEELSDVAGRHPAHLSSEFRRFFGKTISQFVRERRVLRASGLLRTSSANVSEIAVTCGFYDQSHFTHAFSRMMGCTPGQYRDRA